MKTRISIFGFIAVLLLSACAHIQSPEEKKIAQQSEVCWTEDSLFESDGDYNSYCRSNFEQRNKKLSAFLKTADPYRMCQYIDRTDVEQNPLVSAEIERRKIDCRKEAEEEQKRNANPALYYCLDSGFQSGTQAMATCIASWNDQRQQQQMREQQQQQAVQQRQQFQQQQQLQQQQLQQQQQQQQWHPRYPPPVQTHCRTDYNGGMNCTTQ